MNVRVVYDAAVDRNEDPRKDNMMRTLQGLLRNTLRMKNQGVSSCRLAHSQGYADGYMKILVDAGYATEKELLQVVRDVRRGVDGPATTEKLVSEPAESA